MGIWNNHKLSTESNWTPNRLLVVNQNVSAAMSVDEARFGIDQVYGDPDTLMEDDSNNQVVVSSVDCPLNPIQYYI